MSLLGKKWIIKEPKYDDFWQNVFDGYVESKKFEDYWPFYINDLNQGVRVLMNALHNNLKIGVVGDFDVDGSCGTALMIKFLKFYGYNFMSYIPNRFTDGYGLSVKICDMLYDAGVQVLVTIDNGTTAYEAIKHAKQLGMQIVILDHHSIGDKIEVDALINPHANESGFKDLCATGVVFILLYNLNQALGGEFSINECLDFVAIGTVCDVMPIVNINKAFVDLGVKLMNINLKPAFRMLLINHDRIDTETIGFYLGPFLNAPGRMGDSVCTINVLTCDDDRLCDFVMAMIQYNVKRKKVESDILGSIRIDETKRNICVFDDIYEGVMGIIAGRLKEKYSKNTCVINSQNGKGSMRSVSNMHAGQFVRAGVEAGVICFGGGHGAASGFTIDINKIKEFGEFFEKYKVNDYVPEISVSSIVSLSAMNKKFVDKLESFGPFGTNKPLFLMPNCVVKSVYTSVNTCFVKLTNMVHDISSVVYSISSNPLGEIRNCETKVIDVIGYPYVYEKTVKFRLVDFRYI